MFLLLESLGLSLGTAAVGAILFTNSSWLALRFTEGHITFGDVQLLPLVFYCGLHLTNRRIQFVLMSVLALMLLDGAIQPLVFAGMVLICAGFVSFQKTKAIKLTSTIKQLDYRYLGKLSAIFLLMTSVKLIPVLMTLKGRPPMLDNLSMSPRLSFFSFLYPWQKIRMSVTNGLPYVFHEFGCYLGWLASALLLGLFISKRARSEARSYLWLFFFWLWIGTGWGGKFNPWSIFQKIPLVNQAHLQSRTFIIMFLFFVIAVCMALDRIRARRTLWIVLSLFMIAESSFVRFHSSSSLFEPNVPALGRNDLIRSLTLNKTVADGCDVAHYFDMNTSATNCNDRSFLPSSVLPNENSAYRGEIFIQEGKGEVRLLNYIPGAMTVNYRTEGPATIAVNTNNLWGWKSTDPQVQVVSEGIGDLVRFRVRGGEGIATLHYSPGYFYPCILLFLLGCLWYLKMAKAVIRNKQVRYHRQSRGLGRREPLKAVDTTGAGLMTGPYLNSPS